MANVDQKALDEVKAIANTREVKPEDGTEALAHCHGWGEWSQWGQWFN